ncbi:MAG: hypothetical protein QW572_05300 [Candidatus Nitrosocaldus sp.]
MNMVVRYIVNLAVIATITVVMFVVSDTVYAADVVMRVGETKTVSLGRGAVDPRSSDPSIVSIKKVDTREGGTLVTLKCHKAGDVVITYTDLFTDTIKHITVHCSALVIPETPIGLISLVGSSLGALYIFKRIRQHIKDR